jgi:hypothetical protein
MPHILRQGESTFTADRVPHSFLILPLMCVSAAKNIQSPSVDSKAVYHRLAGNTPAILRIEDILFETLVTK